MLVLSLSLGIIYPPYDHPATGKNLNSVISSLNVFIE